MKANASRKLTCAQVLEARDLRSQGYKYAYLAALYGVTDQTIYRAVVGRTFKYLN